MNGLINRSIQGFVLDTYGQERWGRVARSLGLGSGGFESLLEYDDHETDRLVAAVAEELGKDPSSVLEDLGTYLVSHERTQGIRRLLRFCGRTFSDFIHALYDLPSRAALAMPGLVLPELEVREDPPGHFRIFVLAERRGWGDFLLGLLRAMADDYGALVVLERGAGSGTISVIEVRLLDGAFAEGRDFSLSRVDGTKDPEAPGKTSNPIHLDPEPLEAPQSGPRHHRATANPAKVRTRETSAANVGGDNEDEAK